MYKEFPVSAVGSWLIYKKELSKRRVRVIDISYANCLLGMEKNEKWKLKNNFGMSVLTLGLV